MEITPAVTTVTQYTMTSCTQRNHPTLFRHVNHAVTRVQVYSQRVTSNGLDTQTLLDQTTNSRMNRRNPCIADTKRVDGMNGICLRKSGRSDHSGSRVANGTGCKLGNVYIAQQQERCCLQPTAQGTRAQFTGHEQLPPAKDCLQQ